MPGYDVKECPVFSYNDLQDSKLDERERIIDLIIKQQSTGNWTIQTPDVVMTRLIDLIQRLP